jgi:hypothetical protein
MLVVAGDGVNQEPQEPAEPAGVAPQVTILEAA